MKIDRVSAFAPASIGNVSVGFDCLGLALQQPGDIVSIETGKVPGVELIEVKGDRGELPREADKNVAGVVIRAMMDELKRKDALAIRLQKGLPLKSGLGSSAASSVAAAVAANMFLGNPFSRKELIPFVMEGERVACGAPHLDNVAPALLGGIILIRNNDPLDLIPVMYPKELFCAVVHPDVAVATRDARAVLPESISRATAISQSANLAAFICGLQQKDWKLIARSMVDLIAEPARKPLLPHLDAVRKAALDAGALGCGISGSGPSLFALCRGKKVAEKTAAAMSAVYEKAHIATDAFVSSVNGKGAVVL